MFKLRILSLFFLFAFAGSKAFKPQTNFETYDEEPKLRNHNHGDHVAILLKDDGEVDVKIPDHKDVYINEEDESDRAPLLMKRGKGGRKWKGYKYGRGPKWGRGRYYGGYNNYNGPNGPGGWNNGYDNWN
ncbi:uncharacterized protein FA14DRAFT_68848 [Meira miltonrushii]|uniref:Uncharacterized protein n=1 Tax=Meira miltonrushii TaxID=1280837 RepID=A0A316V9H1_9BASI|nr:uncharacterized protein FA14DRAFT_68848 [Meira miltonrushii]PWN34136.1 hypothetical protein FA14DRAFT_68848 [Meira miltonrushii]